MNGTSESKMNYQIIIDNGQHQVLYGRILGDSRLLLQKKLEQQRNHSNLVNIGIKNRRFIQTSLNSPMRLSQSMSSHKSEIFFSIVFLLESFLAYFALHVTCGDRDKNRRRK